MSRRGNCRDNAVAESFFQLLKRERIRRRTYATREQARQDVFDYIEMFYNPKRRHGSNNRNSAGPVRVAILQLARECLEKPGRFSSHTHERARRNSPRRPTRTA